MVQLSWAINTDVTGTDYDWAAITQMQIAPVFDGVLDGFQSSYDPAYNQETAKTEIKAKMTEIWVIRDTEI